MVSAIAPDPSVHVQVGVPIVSDGAIVRVTTSPSLAFPSPLTAIVTAEPVGWVLSIVTDPDPDVTAVPALPLASLKLIV